MRLHAGFATVVWMLVAWAQLPVLSNASEPAGTASKAAVRESFKFDPDDPLVLVPVRVGTKDYQFILDTGASQSVFDVSLRSHLGPCVDSVRVVVPHGGDMELERYSPPNARVGSLALTMGPVFCRDLTSFREASGYSIYGLVGKDVLEHWIIDIDFDEGRVAVLFSGTERDPDWGESVPFMYGTNGAMFITATAGESVRTAFEIDTGNAGKSSLKESLLDRLVSSHEARVTGVDKVVDLSGSHYPRVTRLSHLCLGPFRHDNLQFSSGNQNAIGLNYLSRYRVTIDFPNQRLYLAKGKRFGAPDLGHTCGFDLLFRAGRIEVESVDERGPAHAAGLRAKDVIVKLCGKSVSAWKPSDVHRLLKTEGKTVQVTIERGGKRTEKSFTPKEYD
jgi:hypothetical protein